MPFLVSSDLGSQLGNIFADVSGSQVPVKANQVASAYMSSFQTGLANSLANITVSGIIPGSPPTPYPPTPEPPFAGIYQLGAFKSALTSGFQSIWANLGNTAQSAASQEASLISNQVDTMFLSSVWTMTLHVGVVTITTPGPSALKSSLEADLLQVYQDISGTTAQIKGNQIGTAIEKAMTNYISTITFTVVASAAGGGSTPLSPGSGTGILT